MTAAERPTADIVAFLVSEVDYWRDEAQRLHRRITDATTLLGGPAPGWNEPPEPPVGTRYLTDHDRETAWERRDDGWHCSGPGCMNCPASWSDVWEWEVGRPAVARWERRHGEPLPAARALTRLLPDHAEPEVPF